MYRKIQTIVRVSILITLFSVTSYGQVDYSANINIDGEIISIQSESILQKAKTLVESSKESKKQNLTKSEIKKLAKEYKLLTETNTNPHLSFLDGDISHWYEQKLSERRYRLEFSARQIVLAEADKSGIVIEDQGKLSWAAQQIMANLLKAQSQIRKEQKTKEK
jgi:hypothetical protein